MMSVPVYQLGSPTTVLTGKILMTAGLPGKLYYTVVFNHIIIYYQISNHRIVRFYTLDDSVMFMLQKVANNNFQDDAAHSTST